MPKHIVIAAVLSVAAFFVVRAQDTDGVRFRTVARDQQTDAGALIKSAELAVKHAQYDQADTLYAKAAALGDSPEVAPALLYLGVRALGSGNRLAAQGFFERLLKINPKGPAAGQALSWMAVMQADPDQAEALFKQAMQLQAPNSTELMDTMRKYAMFLRGRGRTEEAAALDQQAKDAQAARTTTAAPAPTTPTPLAQGVYRVGGGVSAPALISKVEPQYTEEARAGKIQGTVLLGIDIGPDGVAGNFEVLRSLEPGLDLKAIEAVQNWRFRPGKKDGAPVTVRATIEVNFRLM
jgi:TonB family protein